jgi:preprotein translocase subunit YajC
LLISPAYAQAAGADAASWTGLLPIALMFVLLYFMMIRPQMKRQKDQKAMVEALQKGDEVIAAGGLLGRITKVSDAYITLEIAEGTEINIQKASAQILLPKGTLKNLA